MQQIKALTSSHIRLTLLAVTLLACSIIPKNIKAQQLPENDIYREYLRTLLIDGSLIPAGRSFKSYRRFSSSSLDSLKHPWENVTTTELNTAIDTKTFSLIPNDPILRSYWQSLEPGGQHDGPIWQGRGFTSDFTTGFFMKYRIFSASFRPHLIYTQNRYYNLSPYDNSGRSDFAYPLGNIDWPQRFGSSSFWSWDLGNSYIRADYRGWAMGVSNEVMQWGPARQNAILLDSNAPGFRHFFISIPKPKDIYVGYLKTKVFWGKLHESDYFDSIAANNERYITGLNLSINPKPTPGLRLGINRIFYETIPPQGIPAGNLLKIFEAFTKINFTSDSNLGGNDQADQLVSLFGEWTFPKSGLEIYGEWARTDHSWDWRGFLTEPEHSRGYTTGLEKTFSLDKNRILSINAEITQLEASKTGEFRGYPTFYVHSRSRQGYTNEGQLLGAAIGPGSSSQYLSGTLYFEKGRMKLFTQRVAQNNDFLYESNEMLSQEIQNPNNNKYRLHNVEMRIGTSIVYFFNQFETEFGLTYRRELNDNYIYNNDKNHWGLKFSLRYRLSPLR